MVKTLVLGIVTGLQLNKQLHQVSLLVNSYPFIKTLYTMLTLGRALTHTEYPSPNPDHTGWGFCVRLSLSWPCEKGSQRHKQMDDE